MELAAFAVFVIALLGGILGGAPLWCSLLFGLCIFFIYGVIRKFAFKALLKMALEGMMSAKNIAVVMLLIGMLTALWRASGTIAYVVSQSIDFIHPQFFLPMVFVMNCIMSVLTGTSFGTIATIGVISMSMGQTLGFDSVLVGGAVMSGAYFGDRCSPVSTSALLVCEVTGTGIYDNIRAMCKTCIVPTIISIALYFILGKCSGISSEVSIANVQNVFAGYFDLHHATLLPAIAIVVLSIFKVDVKITMLVSIAISIILCLYLQHAGFLEILETAFFGFHSEDTSIAKMLDGGGMFGMLKLSVVVCIALSYAGIFRGTNMLFGIINALQKLAQKTVPFFSVLITAIVTNMLACNQSLSIMLTAELCRDFVKDKNRLSLFIENTCITIAPLVPWSIASMIPCEMLQQGKAILPFSFYLYLIPLWQLVLCIAKRKYR